MITAAAKAARHPDKWTADTVTPPARGCPHDRQDKEENDEEDEDHLPERNIVALITLLLIGLGGDLLRFFGWQRQLLDDRIGSRLDAAGHVTGLEAGQDIVVDDQE